ncbi:hypothetical protein [Burkholderia pseudomallei]|uniref:hypothetical protein n=1 Tax=Burkholderia pseudomallei TaxID=28450 RepID=UPI0012F4B28F|nr:hypothetical protein [Burkholderia pseudomallei]
MENVHEQASLADEEAGRRMRELAATGHANWASVAGAGQCFIAGTDISQLSGVGPAEVEAVLRNSNVKIVTRF